MNRIVSLSCLKLFNSVLSLSKKIHNMAHMFMQVLASGYLFVFLGGLALFLQALTFSDSGMCHGTVQPRAFLCVLSSACLLLLTPMPFVMKSLLSLSLLSSSF